MLLFRNRTGEAEQHDKHANLFVVLAGSATLVTGGILKDARDVGPGESRADTMEGGRSQQLRPGDVAYIPASVPYQIVLAGDETISCFAIKIELPEVN